MNTKSKRKKINYLLMALITTSFMTSLTIIPVFASVESLNNNAPIVLSTDMEIAEPVLFIDGEDCIETNGEDEVLTDTDSVAELSESDERHSLFGIKPFPSAKYELNYSVKSDGTVRIDGFIGPYDCGNLVIPETIDGKTVTEIGAGAFKNSTHFHGRLMLPNSITTIGDEAFSSFYSEGSLNLPDSLTTIGNKAFYGSNTFTGELVIPDSVTSIGEEAFAICYGFTGLSLPNSITTIEKETFRSCSGLKGNLLIPNSVITIEEGAFSNCRGLDGKLVLGGNIRSIGKNAFNICDGFTGTLNLPNSLVSIEEAAFHGCSGFTGELTLPSNLTVIENGAFTNCPGFNGGLTIPNAVTSIGESAFMSCSGLTGKLVIPSSVSYIGPYAFNGCEGLTSLSLPNSVRTIGESAFGRCTGFKGTLTIPNGLTTIEDRAFQRCSGFTGELTLPSNVTSIGAYAFEHCEGFSGDLIIGNRVKTIGTQAFLHCSGLSDIYIPANVTSIGEIAFDVGYDYPLTFHCVPGSYAYKWARETVIKVVDWDGKTSDVGADYTITYVLDGGTNDDRNPSSYATPQKAITLYSATKTGYKFNGWYYYKGSKQVKIPKIPKNAKQDYTLYAKWTPISYDISYDLNLKGKGAKNSKNNKKKYTIEDEDFTLAAASAKGFGFVGWYKDKELTEQITKISKGSHGRLTLYAKWRGSQYTVRYNGNGATSGSEEDTHHEYLVGTTPLADGKGFYKKGYHIDYWYLDCITGICTGLKFPVGYTNNILTSEDGKVVDVYAHWTPKRIV